MKLFQKDELKHLGIFYVERFVSTLFFFYPAFWIIYFQQYLNLFQIGILLSIFSVSSFIFEIPTGAVADLWGRKFSTIFGYFLAAGAVLFLYFVHSFVALIFIFIVWGIALTFISGAKESWVVDNLHHAKKKELVKTFFVKEQTIILASAFLAGLLGAYLVENSGLTIIWVFASLSYILASIMLLFIKEHKITKEKKTTFPKLISQSKISIKYVLKNQALLFVILAAFFIMFRDSFGGDIVWQPFLKNLGLPVYAFGFVFSISTLLGVASPFLVKISKRFKQEKNYLALLLLIMIALDFSVVFVNSYIFGVIVLFLMFIAMYMFSPINQSFFHSHVPGKLRATVTSLNGMVGSLAYALSYPLSGYLADVISPRYTIALGAVILIPALFLYLKIKDSYEFRKKHKDVLDSGLDSQAPAE